MGYGDTEIGAHSGLLVLRTWALHGKDRRVLILTLIVGGVSVVMAAVGSGYFRFPDKE